MGSTGGRALWRVVLQGGAAPLQAQHARQHAHKGLKLLRSCSHSLAAPRSRRCIIVHLSKSAYQTFFYSEKSWWRLWKALLCGWLPQEGRPLCKEEFGCAD